jgi:hypothetical protein
MLPSRGVHELRQEKTIRFDYNLNICKPQCNLWTPLLGSITLGPPSFHL